jgi:hypothetical protein
MGQRFGQRHTAIGEVWWRPRIQEHGGSGHDVRAWLRVCSRQQQ